MLLALHGLSALLLRPMRLKLENRTQKVLLSKEGFRGRILAIHES
jgi:hypothetical protein